MKNGAFLAALAPAREVIAISPATQYMPAFPVRERLDQGPFDSDQDEGWLTAHFTTPSEKPIRNPGLGLVGYTWEETGPALAVRAGERSLEARPLRRSRRIFDAQFGQVRDVGEAKHRAP